MVRQLLYIHDYYLIGDKIIDVSISIRQNLDLVCDVDQEGWYPCHLTLEMQIPSFLRRTIREEKRYQWTVR